jgi:hypothetical protein
MGHEGVPAPAVLDELLDWLEAAGPLLERVREAFRQGDLSRVSAPFEDEVLALADRFEFKFPHLLEVAERREARERAVSVDAGVPAGVGA